MNIKNTVWVVYNDSRKNMSSAEKFGERRDIFASIGKTYNGPALIAHARSTLSHWQEGDSLLMVGDPALCAICLAVALEQCEKVQILRWDKNNFNYAPLVLDFEYESGNA